jgi:hypothetical protein
MTTTIKGDRERGLLGNDDVNDNHHSCKGTSLFDNNAVIVIRGRTKDHDPLNHHPTLSSFSPSDVVVGRYHHCQAAPPTKAPFSPASASRRGLSRAHQILMAKLLSMRHQHFVINNICCTFGDTQSNRLLPRTGQIAYISQQHEPQLELGKLQ